MSTIARSRSPARWGLSSRRCSARGSGFSDAPGEVASSRPPTSPPCVKTPDKADQGGAGHKVGRGGGQTTGARGTTEYRAGGGTPEREAKPQAIPRHAGQLPDLLAWSAITERTDALADAPANERAPRHASDGLPPMLHLALPAAGLRRRPLPKHYHLFSSPSQSHGLRTDWFAALELAGAGTP